MRIIAGNLKGRQFHPPVGKWPTRPTTDYARESLFNILQNRIDFEGKCALELFGGTGSHSYELISRGCTEVVFVDNYAPCVAFAKQTAQLLGIDQQMSIVKANVFTFLEKNARQFDYIFADPPYALPQLSSLPDIIFEKKILQQGGIFVLEHGTKHHFQDHPHFTEARTYGDTIFSFFE